MNKMFIEEAKKACRLAGVECTWLRHPPMLAPTLSQTDKCMTVCFNTWRPMWKAQEAAKHELMKQNMKMELNECTSLVDPIKERLAKQRNNLYFWICVTPGELPFGSKNKPKDLGDFANLIEKFINRSCFKSGIACIEQKRTCKEDMRPLHPHAHILVRRQLSCPPQTLRKNTLSTFKKLYKTPPTLQTLYCRPCPIEFIKDKLTYISSGGKTGDGKAAIQQEDERWRVENNFPTYWLNGNISPD